MKLRSAFAAILLLLSGISLALAATQPIHGNTSSRIYHFAQCASFDCKNCTAEFANAAEAEKAGYRACKKCGPSTPRAVASNSASFVGNAESLKFHRSTCRNAGCKNCTRSFATRENAISAGFVPGKCCNP